MSLPSKLGISIAPPSGIQILSIMGWEKDISKNVRSPLKKKSLYTFLMLFTTAPFPYHLVYKRYMTDYVELGQKIEVFLLPVLDLYY